MGPYPDHFARRSIISVVANEERRLYSELDEAGKAIIEHALPRDTIDREEVVNLLSETFSEKAVQEAFTKLKKEDRLFRRGNKSEYVLIRRDLF